MMGEDPPVVTMKMAGKRYLDSLSGFARRKLRYRQMQSGYLSVGQPTTVIVFSDINVSNLELFFFNPREKA